MAKAKKKVVQACGGHKQSICPVFSCAFCQLWNSSRQPHNPKKRCIWFKEQEAAVSFESLHAPKHLFLSEGEAIHSLNLCYRRVLNSTVMETAEKTYSCTITWYLFSCGYKSQKLFCESILRHFLLWASMWCLSMWVYVCILNIETVLLLKGLECFTN